MCSAALANDDSQKAHTNPSLWPTNQIGQQIKLITVETQLVFKEELLRAESRTQLVQPSCLGIVFGEERTLNPLGVAGLDKPQRKNFLATYLGHALDLDFARTGAHRRSARRATEARDLLDCVAINLPRSLERQFEIAPRSGVALDKHIVRHHSHMQKTQKPESYFLEILLLKLMKSYYSI
jgi:hypothetical protein